MSIEAMLIFEEGREHKAYPDPISRGEPWTIGVGHTGPEVRGDTVWTDEQIDAALAADIDKARRDCDNNIAGFRQLNPARQAVLISMAFQMGLSRLMKFTNTLASVRAGKYDAASAGMLASVWGHQTPHRVVRLAEQMRSGQWDPNYLKD